MLRRTAWVWLAGAIAWTLDAFVSVYYRHNGRAGLAFAMAVIFGCAYAFYVNQRR